MMPQAARAGTLMAQRARVRQSLDGQVRDLLTGDHDVAEAAAEEIDGLGALGRDVPVSAVVLDLDGPRDLPPLNLWRLPRAVGRIIRSSRASSRRWCSSRAHR